jgi:hypothetical protein
MPYIFAIIAAASFATGYGLSSVLSRAEIQHMSDGIAAQNREAELTLQTLTEQADKDKAAAINANKQLEAANVSTINAINSQRDNFKFKRLYDTNRARSSCATARPSDSPVTTNTPTDDGQLSNELTEFLKSEAYRADEIAAYATLCKNYISTLKELSYAKLE